MAELFRLVKYYKLPRFIPNNLRGLHFSSASFPNLIIYIMVGERGAVLLDLRVDVFSTQAALSKIHN